MPIGFSTAILSQSASIICMKNTHAFCCRKSFCFSGNHLAPLTAKSVQGGWAITRSHRPPCSCVIPSIVVNEQFPLSNGKQSPWICHSGCPPLHSWMSQEKALCPRARNALHTSWLSSQATNTFIMSLPFLSFSRTKSASNSHLGVFFLLISVCSR